VIVFQRIDNIDFPNLDGMPPKGILTFVDADIFLFIAEQSDIFIGTTGYRLHRARRIGQYFTISYTVTWPPEVIEAVNTFIKEKNDGNKAV
jgi:hypothetical protein